MKKALILTLSAALLSACGGSTPTATTTSANTPATKNTNETLVVSSHSTEKTAMPKSDSAVTAQPASPNQMPVDVADSTAKIAESEKALKAKPTDEKLKEQLAAAYFERAFTLTKAAQYRAALGDFRKGLKLNPKDTEAKAMHDQIIDIFKSIGREPPKEGEEPAPMPMK